MIIELIFVLCVDSMSVDTIRIDSLTPMQRLRNSIERLEQRMSDKHPKKFNEVKENEFIDEPIN